MKGKCELNGETGVIGIFGYPLTYTLSPLFQNLALRERGVNAVYVPFPVEAKDFKALARSLMRAKNFIGANVTNPYKIAVMGLVDELTPEAGAVGAVNTIFRRGGAWVGHNTDAEGFILAAKAMAGQDARGRRVLILGAGGASRAIVHACLRAGAEKVSLTTRFPGEIKAVRAWFKKRAKRIHSVEFTPQAQAAALRGHDWIVNTIPLPAFTRRIGQQLKAVRTRKTVIDITYVPVDTALLKTAQKAGHRTVNGLRMLLEQGVKSFACWVPGRVPGKQKLWKALLAGAK